MENIFLNVPKNRSKPAVLVVKGDRPLILQKEVLIMPRKRKEIPELEKMLQYGKKKFVRYDEGAKLYSSRNSMLLKWECRLFPEVLLFL